MQPDSTDFPKFAGRGLCHIPSFTWGVETSGALESGTYRRNEARSIWNSSDPSCQSLIGLYSYVVTYLHVMKCPL